MTFINKAKDFHAVLKDTSRPRPRTNIPGDLNVDNSFTTGNKLQFACLYGLETYIVLPSIEWV